MGDSMDRLSIGVAGHLIGTLGRAAEPGQSTFGYLHDASAHDAVSLTMPVRLDSYRWENGIAPIFEMNLPEGALRAELTRRFSKAIKGFDDFALLGIVGPHQLGRVSIDSGAQSCRTPPATDLGQLLVHDGAQGLFEDLLQTYAQYSGVSGVQPKVLVTASDSGTVERVTHRAATHLVKTFVPDDFPELATNEFFCMRAAFHANLQVPEIELSQQGKLLLVKRFDMDEQGYLGFEDFCVLNAWPSRAKYDGSYEGAARQIRDFVSPMLQNAALESYFKTIALCAAVQNGDAHLKNFGVLYKHCADDAQVSLAPTYDVVTTTVYIKNDSMALLLGGSKAWPKHKALLKFGRIACRLSEGRCHELLAEVAYGVAQAEAEMKTYMARHERFNEVGTLMLNAWAAGSRRSLHPG